MPGFELWSDAERKEVNEVLETGILMRYGFDGLRQGKWKSDELEQAICKKFNCKHAQLTSSGTSALTTALAALGIGAGDEVIMPCFTFVASFEAVLSVGAVPILVDVDETLTLNPESVRNAINQKTKCVMPVHMCGSMAELDALGSICKEHGLLLLEDRLHLRELRQRLAQIDTRLLHFFERGFQLIDQLLDLGILLFAGELFERLQLLGGPIGRADNHIERRRRTGIDSRRRRENK